MRFRFIAAEKAHHALSRLCRCLRVTRSGFYAWQGRPESARTKRDRQLKVLVHASFTASKQRYGSPRIHRDLLEQKVRVSRKRVIRLMQEEGLKARVRKRFKCTTMSDHDHPVAANLLDRQFTAEAPSDGSAIRRSSSSARAASCIWPRSWICSRVRRRLGCQRGQ